MKVLITGGRSEIAQAIAKNMQANEHEVSVTASSQESCLEVEEIYKAMGVPVKVYVYNLSEMKCNKDFEKYLKNDCESLVLNAAAKVEKLKLFHHTTIDDINKSLEADVLGNCFLIQRVLEGMIKRKFGRIIFISSTISTMGSSRYGIYSMTKNAIEGLIRNLSIDYGKHNILSNIIRPGLMQTERTKRFWSREGYLDKVSKLVPQGRMGKPEDIASVVNCLTDENCYINGEEINVGGGLPRFRTEGVL